LVSQIKVKHRLRVSKNGWGGGAEEEIWVKGKEKRGGGGEEGGGGGGCRGRHLSLREVTKDEKISYQGNSSFTPHQILLR